MKKRIVLLRHGQSLWNKENKFTGWTDVILTPEGLQEAKKAAILLRENNFVFDYCFTSYLSRAIDTLNIVLKGLNQEYLPVEKSWRLNEKHYGVLQGLNKTETAEKYGAKQVQLWRRSFDIAPAALDEEDPRNPALDPMYKKVSPNLLPRTESLKDTIARTLPYWQGVIFPKLKDNDTLLIVAHGNSLRGIIKHLKNISNEDIINLNLPTAVPYVFEFDENLNLVKDYFLGDPEEIKNLMTQVANQANKK